MHREKIRIDPRVKDYLRSDPDKDECTVFEEYITPFFQNVKEICTEFKHIATTVPQLNRKNGEMFDLVLNDQLYGSVVCLEDLARTSRELSKHPYALMQAIVLLEESSREVKQFTLENINYKKKQMNFVRIGFSIDIPATIGFSDTDAIKKRLEEAMANEWKKIMEDFGPFV
jgi:hypothetical protein